MALNYGECEEMLQACDAAGVPLWVAYYRRALPRFLRVRQLLAPRHWAAALRLRPAHADAPPAVLFAATLPWRVHPEIAGGGLFVDLASHTLDILDFWFGPIAQVEGHASNQAGLYPAEDTVTASFVHESGVHGAGVWCFAACANED